MIAAWKSFVDSWPLFSHAYLSAWLAAILLSITGIWVVARNQIFLGVALSQFSALGVALGLWLSANPSAFCLSLWAVSFSIGGAVVMTLSKRGNLEAKVGWLYLLSASLSILVVARSPFGLEEVHRLISSTLIGAARLDVGIFAALAVFAVVFVTLFHRPLLLLLMDPEMAAVAGMRVFVWNLGISVWLGLSLGLAIRVVGVLFAFGCLVLPALIARFTSRTMTSLLWQTPVTAVLATALGLVTGHHFDFPPGQVIVAILAAAFLAGEIMNLRKGGFRL